MIYDYQVMAGIVDQVNAPAWFNEWKDNTFHEVGTSPSGWTIPTPWRVSFTPSAPGMYAVMGAFYNRSGDGVFRGRDYCKARVARVTPSYKNDFSMYGEALIEEGIDSGDVMRWLNIPIPLLAVDTVTAERVGVLHTYCVEHLAGDALEGQVSYGSPLLILG